MKIKVLYREITCCEECPYCHEYALVNSCRALEKYTEIENRHIILSNCPLPDMRLDTEDDSTE